MTEPKNTVTVVFVHGTGVRKRKFTKTFELVRRALEAIPDVRAVPCYWGEPYGAILRCDGASIPEYDTSRGEELLEDLDPLELWGLLYQDPLYELRLLAIAAPAAVEWPPGRESPGDTLDDHLAALPLDELVGGILLEPGVRDFLEEARITVRDSRPYRDALGRMPDEPSTYRIAVARALVAQVAWYLEQQDELPMAAWARDHAVAVLVDALGGTERAVAGWIAGHALDIGMRLGGTQYLRRRRRSLTDAVYPEAGDILHYLAHGQKLRRFVADQVRHAGSDVVLLGHSLGGVISVDLLSMEELPQVKLLVTVGSQVALLYEIDALPGLPDGAELPASFPKWLNVFDPNDLLSYSAQGIFGDCVTDLRLDNRQPFPTAHSAYWKNPALWRAIAEKLTP